VLPVDLPTTLTALAAVVLAVGKLVRALKS